MPDFKIKTKVVLTSVGSPVDDPDNFSALKLGTAVELTWDAVTGATTYKLYRNTVNDLGTATLINNTNIIEYVDTNRASATTYYYWVQEVVGGVDSAGVSLSVTMGTYRTDIIVPGTIGSPTTYFLHNANDFNTLHSFAPGDVILLQAGYYNTIDFEGAYEDITICSESTGTVNIVGRVNFGPKGKHHKLIGNLAASKNIVISSGLGGYFASSSRGSGTVYYRNLDLQDNFMGLQVEHRESTDPEYPSYLLDYQDLTIRDVNIDGTGQEAMYIGSNIISDHQIYGTIRDCTVANCGRDGIQVRNGLFDIYNNTIADVGTNLEDAHGHGILYGGGGGDLILKTYIRNNTVTNARVYGMFINGYGNIWIEDNVVTSLIEAGIFIKNYESDTEDILSIGFQYITLKNNNFNTSDPSLPLAVDIRRDPAKCPMTVDYYSTNVLNGDGKYIEDGTNGPNNGIVTNNL